MIIKPRDIPLNKLKMDYIKIKCKLKPFKKGNSVFRDY